MTDENNTNSEPSMMNAVNPGSPKGSPRWGRRIAIGAGAIAVVAGIGVATAMSNGFGHHGWGRAGMMKDFAEFRLTRTLGDIGASADQTDKIKVIFNTTMDEVMPKGADGDKGKGPMGAMRTELEAILKAPTIDRAAIETVRAEHIAKMDEKSKIVAKAVGDIAEILTVEQRAKLIAEFDHHGDQE